MQYDPQRRQWHKENQRKTNTHWQDTSHQRCNRPPPLIHFAVFLTQRLLRLPLFIQDRRINSNRQDKNL